VDRAVVPGANGGERALTIMKSNHDEGIATDHRMKPREAANQKQG
jgi:hypothetical protein